MTVWFYELRHLLSHNRAGCCWCRGTADTVFYKERGRWSSPFFFRILRLSFMKLCRFVLSWQKSGGCNAPGTMQCELPRRAKGVLEGKSRCKDQWGRRGSDKTTLGQMFLRPSNVMWQRVWGDRDGCREWSTSEFGFMSAREAALCCLLLHPPLPWVNLEDHASPFPDGPITGGGDILLLLNGDITVRSPPTLGL